VNYGESVRSSVQSRHLLGCVFSHTGGGKKDTGGIQFLLKLQIVIASHSGRLGSHRTLFAVGMAFGSFVTAADRVKPIILRVSRNLTLPTFAAADINLYRCQPVTSE
jgi:hypothetical protein